ncbi:Pentatricopeptide repeat - like 10 [Theobroma cacao]|nr:Pentatricopeptide repeat - like 10 [Theobroma cacao]
MRGKGIPPTVVTSNSLIHAMCNSCLWLVVKTLVVVGLAGDIVNLERSSLVKWLKMDPDTISYNTLNGMQVTDRETFGCTRTLQTNDEYSWRSTKHDHLLCFVIWLMHAWSWILLGALIVKGLHPNVYNYSTMIKWLRKEGLPDEAYLLLREMEVDDGVACLIVALTIQ